MIMVAVIVRELPYLKLLTPIMFELHKHGVKYILYYMDSFKGEKEYSRPTVARLKESNEKIGKAKFVIYLKGEKDGEGEKTA